MSGHSKWATTHRQKETTDAKKGAIFTKLANQITLATREGGANPESNFKLRLAIDKARTSNMPNDNVARAIKRGSGELAGQKFEEAVYELMAPEGVAILLEVLTDNKNRIMSDIKKLANGQGFKIAESGSLLWQFKKQGVLTLDLIKNLKTFKVLTADKISKEEMELALIDLGAEDFSWQEETLTIYTKPEELAKTKQALESAGYLISEAELELVPNNPLPISEELKEKLSRFFELADENPEINNFYTNAA
ncbi:MAG: YebC/PmpR family DNA-binding transcriptional regulator [Candidatus Buchananbacteria bacterium]